MNGVYETQRDTNEAKREGPIARAIEEQTSKVPSDIFLWAAGAAIVGSLVLEVVGMRRSKMSSRLFSTARRDTPTPLAGFIGMWAPTLLLLGIYNKIVKVAGHDRLT